MNVVRWEPFRDLMSLQNRMNSIFDETLRQRGAESAEEDVRLTNWAPAVDISETDDRIVLRAEVPGVRESDIDLQVSENVLTLKGERRFEKEEKGENFHRIERAYGTFSRSFTLPATVDRERIAADYDAGVLTVTLPKKEETKPRQIKVAIGKGS